MKAIARVYTNTDGGAVMEVIDTNNANESLVAVQAERYPYSHYLFVNITTELEEDE